MMPTDARALRSKYNQDAILSATPVRLLTMLYDRLMLDLALGEAAQQEEDWQAASGALLHAQAIISELSSSLKVELWEGGEGLRAIYAYVTTALIGANVHRDIERTKECARLLEPLRQAWHDAAAQLPAQQQPQPALADGALGVA